MTARRKTTKRDILRALAPTGRRAEMPTNLRMEVMDITPHMATVWLEGKTNNRSVSDTLVERFARDMKVGAWHLNGEAIVFDEDDRLMDGQHRLWAIVMAQVTVRMVVIFGAKSASMETFDTGRARTFSDALKIRGKSNNTTMAAAARWFHWYDHSTTGETYNAGGQPTHYELSRTVAAHPMIEPASSLVQSAIHARRLLSPGILAFVVAGGMERDPEKAAAFLDQFNKGLGFTDTDPVYHLHNIATANAASKLRKLRPMIMAAYTIKAWNAFLKDRPVRKIKWQSEGEKPEAFPRFED